MRAVMKSNRSSFFSSLALGRRISINALKFSMNLINIKYTFEKMKHYFFYYLASLIMKSRRELQNASLFTRRYLRQNTTTSFKQPLK